MKQLIFAFAIIIPCVYTFRIACWYTNWSQYRPVGGKFSPGNINPNLCTHIYYAFANVAQVNGEWGLKTIEWNDEAKYAEMMALKSANPNLKVLLAAGGWNHGTATFNDMSSRASTRAQFLKNVVSFLRKYKFDGLDYDWEYPGDANRGSGPETKQQFSDLVKETRMAFDAESLSSGLDRLLVTASVGVTAEKAVNGYDIPVMNKYLDWTNLMTYDLHGAWEKFLGHNSPLYPRSDETHSQSQLNADVSVRYWIAQGYNPANLLLGVGSYGRSFTLQDANRHDMGDPAARAGSPGPFTRENGFLGYYEICQKAWPSVFHDEHKVPYAYDTKSMQWVGYDDMTSIRIKADYVCANQLGGIHMWALDMDDFSGNFCKHGMNYPLLRTINSGLKACGSQPVTPAPTQAPTQAPTKAPTQAPTKAPTQAPTKAPTQAPTKGPTQKPTEAPTQKPTEAPTQKPTELPTKAPTEAPTQKPTEAPTQPPTTASNGKFICPKENGYFPHPTSCRKFYHCAMYTAFAKNCPPSMYYNPKTNLCDYEYNVPSCIDGNPGELAPFVCPSDGIFPDPGDDGCFYNCANDVPYHSCCLKGLVFDNQDLVCRFSIQ